MSFIAILFINLFKQLLGSRGRAYYVPANSDLEKLSKAIDGNGAGSIATAIKHEPHGDAGYSPGDTGIINGGLSAATYIIIGVSGGGVITGFAIDNDGSGYNLGTDVETTATSGSGIGFTVDITAIVDGTYNVLGTSERLVNDGNRLLDSCLPDNLNFSDGTENPDDNDCNDLERRLGLKQYGITDPPVTPTTGVRKMAIAQKMRYPGTTAPRQARSYLEESLQSAGFPVFVYENLDNKTPAEILGVPTGRSYYGAFDYGEVDYGEDWDIEDVTVIANSVDPVVDDDFVIPSGNNHGTFFIGGSTIGAFASIPVSQETQFRQLVLNLKPAHMVAFTFINFV